LRITGGRRPVAALPEQESQMPKIKTKSGAKSASRSPAPEGAVRPVGKRHGMIKRTPSRSARHRGTKVMFKTDGDRIKNTGCRTADRRDRQPEIANRAARWRSPSMP